MNIKKIISLCLTFCLVLALVGCGSKEPEASKLSIFAEDGGKKIAYTVIRAKNSSAQIDDAAKKIRSSLKAGFGGTVKMTYDETVEDFDGNLEILIGNTNREETQKAKEVLKNNRESYYLDFIIKVIGDKIVIYSENEAMLIKAVDYFAETYCKDEEAWNKLDTSTEIIYEAPIVSRPHEIGGVTLNNFTIVTPRDMEYIYGRAIYELVDYLNGDQGYTIPVVDQRTAASKHEILIGNLDREESRSITVEGDNSYIIKAINGKLVIKASDSASLGCAFYKFIDMIYAEVNNGGYLKLSGDYELKGSYEPAESEYRYTWGDEFNTGKIDNNYWVDYKNMPYGDVSQSVLGGTSTRKTLELIEAKDGCAVLSATRDGANFETSQMSTFDTMQYLYGIIEIRAKLPIRLGQAAFWCNGASLGTGAMTEYDILENFGYSDNFACNIHNWAGNNYHTSLDNAKYKDEKKFEFNDALAPDEDLSSDFHVYTMAWDDKEIKFAVDGKVFFTYSLAENENSDIHSLPVYFITSCGWGSANYGLAVKKDDPSHCSMSIDYIRLYQRKDIGKLYLRDEIPLYGGREYSRLVMGK